MLNDQSPIPGPVFPVISKYIRLQVNQPYAVWGYFFGRSSIPSFSIRLPLHLMPYTRKSLRKTFSCPAHEPLQTEVPPYVAKWYNSNTTCQITL
jgi:hypothetical protein